MRIVRLVDSIDYRDGFIANRQEVADPESELRAVATDFEVVETHVRGWGSANAVIKSRGQHYLAKIK